MSSPPHSESSSFKCNCDAIDEGESKYVNGILGHRYHRLGTRHLSCGGFGIVIKAIDQKSNHEVVVKIFPTNAIRKTEVFSEGNDYSFDIIEIARLKTISDFSGRGKMFLSLMEDYMYWEEYAGIVFSLYGPDLYNLTHQAGRLPLMWDDVRTISYQIMEGIKFLHDNGMAHMDIKPENIVTLCGETHEVAVTNAYCINNEFQPQVFLALKDPRIRIVDFGSSESFAKTGTVELRSNTNIFRAPELILGLDCNYKCDNWSIGCTIIEIYYGFSLFPSTDDIGHLAAIQKSVGNFPEWMISQAEGRGTFRDYTTDLNRSLRVRSQHEKIKIIRPFEEHIIFGPAEDSKTQLKQLLRSLLEVDPERRSTLTNALEQPYFTDLPDYIRIDVLAEDQQNPLQM